MVKRYHHLSLTRKILNDARQNNMCIEHVNLIDDHFTSSYTYYYSIHLFLYMYGRNETHDF